MSFLLFYNSVLNAVSVNSNSGFSKKILKVSFRRKDKQRKELSELYFTGKGKFSLPFTATIAFGIMVFLITDHENLSKM